METEADLAFRRAMSAFATGVAVVTAKPDGGALCGITVNSLTSVSLNPRLLLWCLGDESARYDVFANASLWGVAVLGADQEELALRFARAESQAVAEAEVQIFHGASVLRAGVAQFACRTHLRQAAGDHLVIVGEVMGFRTEPGPALTFFRGRYGRADDWST